MEFLSLRSRRLSCESSLVARSEERRLYLQGSFTQESCRHLHRQSIYLNIYLLFIIFVFVFLEQALSEGNTSCYQCVPGEPSITLHSECAFESGSLTVFEKANSYWWLKTSLSPSYLHWPIIPVEDPGKGPGPLFLNQTEAEGSK